MKNFHSIRVGVFGAWFVFTSLALSGCQESKKKPPPLVEVPPPPVPKGTYPDGQVGLKKLWQDILSASQKRNIGELERLLASLGMTQEELTGLIGPEHAKALWPGYKRMMTVFYKQDAEVLAKVVNEKEYDDVSALRVDELPAAEQSATDRRVLKALIRPMPIYAVRIKRNGEERGLRYDFFVYLDGSWRTGSRLGEELPFVPPPQAPATPVTPSTPSTPTTPSIPAT